LEPPVHHRAVSGRAPPSKSIHVFENVRHGLPPHLGGTFAKSEAEARSLLDAPGEAVVLHGDFHHDNVMDGGPRGWLAIDPKGLIGEREFEFANLFRNTRPLPSRAGKCSGVQKSSPRKLR
jgi:streptomycin 6-kinase